MHISDGYSPGKSNFSKILRGIGTSGVIRVPKNTGPEKCADRFINRSVSPKKFEYFSIINRIERYEENHNYLE